MASPPDGHFVETPCPFCHGFVDVNDPTVYQQVMGWVRPRLRREQGSKRLVSQGGANQIALREPLLMWAHARCVEKEKKARKRR